ncbi:MAG: glycosyltransferase family 39 protein [Anaerolineae bacterium]|nr:glycosyltransferase family 39 protein [Anaerolineae bacterium]
MVSPSTTARTGIHAVHLNLRLFLLLALLLLAFALRVYRLDAQSIWIDESISLYLATASPGEIIANRASNVHPPLYFLLLKVWVMAVGTAVFPARFFSVLFSLLQVPLVYAVARRRIGEWPAWIAAALTSLSPLSVIYAQEIRTYAILPLVYLALLETSYRLLHGASPQQGNLWFWWGLFEVIGMHLHYSALFLAACVTGSMLLTLWRSGRREEIRRCLTVQVVVGMACLPWLSAVVAHRAEVQAYLEQGAGLTEQVPLDYLLRQVWVFFLTGLTGLLRVPEVRLLATAAFLLLSIQVGFQLYLICTRGITLRLLADWLFPLGATLLFWAVRSYSHPRYLALYAPGLTLLAAWAILAPARAIPRPCSGRLSTVPALFSKAMWGLSLGISILLGSGLIVLSILGLRAYFFDPHFAKDDVRGVARYLEETAGEGDLILIPFHDWSLTFTYRGITPVRMAVPDPEQLLGELERWSRPPQRVYIMDYRGVWMDWHEAVFFALETAGTKLARKDFKGIALHLYRISRPIRAPLFEPRDARFGPLELTHAWVDTTSPADTALPLALRWRCREATGQRHTITIRLQDVTDSAGGWPVVAHDQLLLDEHMRPTDRWPAGHETTSYHILPLPTGIPPLSYTLSIGLYTQTDDGVHPIEVQDGQGVLQGQWLNLGTVYLTRTLGLTGNPYRVSAAPPALPQPAVLADGLLLLGARLDRDVLAPGQSLVVTLHWQATRAPLPDLWPRLALVQEGQELGSVASAPVGGRYPTSRWQEGEEVIERRSITLPPTAPAGRAEVVLSVGEQRISLGHVEVEALRRNFTPPPISHPLDVPFGEVARLIGYALSPPPFTSAAPITLTLYWQVLEEASAADYLVFTHILAADGHLVGQHDGPPALGTRPSRGWVTGEIVTDVHPMTFREPYSGPAYIEVGLYRQDTLERVPRADNGETYLLLPLTITVQSVPNASPP